MTTDTPDQPASRPHKRGALNLVIVAFGVVAFAAGLFLLIWASFHPASSFGWTAYAPLSSTIFLPNQGGNLTTWGQCLTSLGLILIAFWAGLSVGRRQR
jgi:heme/copper-type cytochrome/quinol oxidase subunit 1